MFDSLFGMSEEEYEAELVRMAEQSDDPSAKRWLELRNRPPLSPKEIEQILVRMSEYNPDAPEILRKYRLEHADELGNDEAAP